MKRALILIYLIINISHIYAIGININYCFNMGFTECLFGKQIKRNVNVWDDKENFNEYINYGNFVSTDIVFNKNLTLEIGAEYKNISLHFYTTNEKMYSNGNTNLQFSILKIPILYKISIPLSKSSKINNFLDFAAGINTSFIISKIIYKDELTKDIGNFISNPVNFGFTLKITYSHKIGPGFLFAGILGDINFNSSKYYVNSYDIDMGKITTISPILGYSIVIKETQYKLKTQEKRKRITDFEVK